MVFPIKLLSKKNNKMSDVNDETIIAICNGEMIDPKNIEDPIFAECVLGQTIGFIPKDGLFVSPCNGTLEVLFPTKHAFAIRANDGTGYLVHIGIDTVSMNGDGFKVFKSQGDTVKAGEKIVEVNLNKIRQAGHPITTMLIITERNEGKVYNFIDYGKIVRAQVISQ